MIKPHHFATLALATAASVLLAIGALCRRQPLVGRQGRGHGRCCRIYRDRWHRSAAIEITQGDKKATLERAGEQWRIKERGGYPAKPERVRALLVALAQAELIEPRTASKDKRQAARARGSRGQGRQVARPCACSMPRARPIGEIVLGKSRARCVRVGQGRHLRAPSEARRRPGWRPAIRRPPPT